MSPSPDWRYEPTVTGPAVSPPVRQVGQYDLIEILGRGGMGVVWKAIHRHLGQTVAVKFLSPDSWSDPQAVARFYREMKAAGRVSHSNVVRAYDAGQYDGHHILVMECIEGRTLRDVLTDQRTLSVPVACEILRQASAGLSAISAAGMVHRDLKPSNLFLTTDGVVKILDLGLARFQVDAAEADLTISGNLLGTIVYMAPEQSSEPRAVDVRSDLYSLGCTLFAFLAGAPPFAGGDRSSLESRLRAHRVEPPPRISLFRSDVPPELSDLIDRLLAKPPASRLGSAEELTAVLSAFVTPDAGGILKELARSESSDSAKAVPRRADSSRRVTHSAVETSEVPVSPSETTPRERQRLSSATARTSSPKGKWIGAIALGLVVAATAGYYTVFPGGRTSEKPDALPAIAADGAAASLSETNSPAAAIRPADTNAPPTLIDYTDSPRLQWNDLLKHRPIPFHWTAGEGLAHWIWQDEQSQLLVSNNERGLISLGRVNADDFRIQVGVHQNGWAGGIGIFMGLDDAGLDPLNPKWSCQVLSIHQTAGPNGARGNRVDFSTLQAIASPKGGVEFHETAHGSEAVRGLVGEALFEVTIRDGRAVQIQIDGVPFRDLLEAASSSEPPARWKGRFGVYVDGGDSTVRNARIMILNAD